MNDVHFIADRQALNDICVQLRDSAWLALDTEFIREKTYYPQLALLQVSNGESIYCIDPLAIDDLLPFYTLLENTAITKVLHAASQDLEIYYCQRGCLPGPVFDTQIAASLLGLGEQIGYATLVKKLLNIELDKSHARTDWMRRPLHDEQLRYAADDVRYLSRLYPLLYSKLEKLNRLRWLDDESERLLNPATYTPDPPNSWRRIKGAGKLRRKQLNILRHLAAWREQQAIQNNRPRRWILSDEALLNLAMLRPADHEALLRVRLLERKFAERHAAELLALIKQAADETEDNWPRLDHSRKPNAHEEATIDMLMAVAHLCADEHQLSPGQITSRSELLKLVRNERNLPLLNGWRLHVAGEKILNTYLGKLQLVCEQGRIALKSV